MKEAHGSEDDMARAPAPAPLTPLPLLPDASSRDRLWDGVIVDLHAWKGPGRVTSHVTNHSVVAVRISGVTPLVQRRDGKTHRGLATPGTVTAHPRDMVSSFEWQRPGAIVLLRFPPKLLTEAAESGPHPSQTELPNCFGVRDPFVEHIGLLLAEEIEQPSHPAQLMIAQSLSCALAHHMIYRFGRPWPGRSERPSGLAERSLSRVLAYIEENLGEPATLAQLAQLANVSRFHFARLFRCSIGLSPMAYIERARLQRAKDLIRSGSLSLTEIAALLGFADQSHFTRRFRRQFGYTPSAFAREQRLRKEKPPDLLITSAQQR
jgi:AraC family transcriptional regulator